MFTQPDAALKIEAVCPKCEVYQFLDSESALQQWELIPFAERVQMATIYQQAFARAPWYEVGKCTACGKFLPDLVNPCSNCGGSELIEAYPIDDLLSNDLPKMITSFLPGFLIAVKDDEGEIVGWTSCGFATLADLVTIKYGGKQEALAGISELGLTPETILLYLNEACVNPGRQQSGFGTNLALTRMLYASENNVPVVLSRTVNAPWLHVNQQIMAELGYEVRQTVLPGDETYVANSPRYTYIGVKTT